MANEIRVRCAYCGELVPPAKHCKNCGAALPEIYVETPAPASPAFTPEAEAGISRRSRLTALLLSIFLGALGIHRFYLGKPITGVLWLLTLGLGGVGILADAIMIVSGIMVDGNGRAVVLWHPEDPQSLQDYLRTHPDDAEGAEKAIKVRKVVLICVAVLVLGMFIWGWVLPWLGA